MASSTSIMEVTGAILDSYSRDGGINHLCGPNLPAREEVANILRQFEDVCFPGFFREEELHPESIEYVTGHKLVRLYDELTEQIFKNFLFQARRVDRDAPIRQRETWDKARDEARSFLQVIPGIRQVLMTDVQALLDGDPAARSQEEVILSYPGLRAILVHRVAHHFWNQGLRLLARMMSEHTHSLTGIDIHPGAQIGSSFHMDHGTGVVIGETTVIGDHVKVYQGVSLGALSVSRKLADQKRHPTIEDYVTIYAGATILGGDTVVGHHSVVGGNVWLVQSVPPHSVVENDPRIRVMSKAERKSAGRSDGSEVKPEDQNGSST